MRCTLCQLPPVATERLKPFPEMNMGRKRQSRSSESLADTAMALCRFDRPRAPRRASAFIDHCLLAGAQAMRCSARTRELIAIAALCTRGEVVSLRQHILRAYDTECPSATCSKRSAALTDDRNDRGQLGLQAMQLADKERTLRVQFQKGRLSRCFSVAHGRLRVRTTVSIQTTTSASGRSGRGPRRCASHRRATHRSARAPVVLDNRPGAAEHRARARCACSPGWFPLAALSSSQVINAVSPNRPTTYPRFRTAVQTASAPYVLSSSELSARSVPS